MPTTSGFSPDARRDGVARKGLRHRPVPCRLRLDESRKGGVGAQDLRIVLAMDRPMLAIDLEQEIPVGARCGRGPADPFTLGLGHGVPALFGDGLGQFLVDVERDHRDPVDPRELEERQIELGRQLPDGVPLGLLEQLPHREIARHPAVQHRLRAAWKHLEADHHVGALCVQRRQHLQLPTVIIVLVVLLAQQHHVFLRHPRDDCGLTARAWRIAVEDRPGRRIEARLRGARGVRVARRNADENADSGRAADEGGGAHSNESSRQEVHWCIGSPDAIAFSVTAALTSTPGSSRRVTAPSRHACSRSDSIAASTSAPVRRRPTTP